MGVSLTPDYYYDTMPLEEIKSKLDAISVDSALTFLEANKFRDYTLVTIGPKQVEHVQAGHSNS